MGAPHDAAATRTRDSIEKTVEFVRLGFHDVSLNFTVQLGATDHLADVFNACGPYNDFEPEAAFIALAPVFPQVMEVVFGRESTPILMLRVPYWEHQQIGYELPRQQERLTDTRRLSIAQRAVDALHAAGAARVDAELVTGAAAGRVQITPGEVPFAAQVPSVSDWAGVGITIEGRWH